ncbi:chemotaxis protein CheW [Pseudobacteroides cellulosolvens]|uniref:Stage 0 sporulation protein A homolog n=1 Tax=Pseudobacteroides cellulosolvens ATCC 35603 = DSM 2933 TaxID=398512 RepID=A0A0L6JV78_9FIRM|nr:chemotaxis protein CheW [Pseudobacteroides cellulosolvens]KNY29560.1 CheA signal transduction histidine kinase [Pseudobacteroides cellulosolvens ATCC 35603 = DSM 2933]
MIQNQEFIQEFIDEARTHLEKVEALLIKKEKLVDDSEAINEIFRAVHSIKGTAGFFGLKKIVSLAHAMENIFAEVRNGKIKLNVASVDVILSSNDQLKNMIEDVLNSEDVDISEDLQKLGNILMGSQTGESGDKEDVIFVAGNDKRGFVLKGCNKELLADGIKHGHRIYELRLRLNKDLLSYTEGPVQLFNRIQSVGMVIDTITDHSEINSFDDVIEAVVEGSKDVYLGIFVTTVLDMDMFSDAIGVSKDNIFEYIIDRTKESDNHFEIREKEQLNGSKGEESKEEMTNEVMDNQDKALKQVKQLKVEDNIRVNVTVLNDLLNMASEMVLGRNQLLRTLEEYRKSIPGLSAILQNIDRLTSGMQEKIMQTRMQPIANIFNKFPRIIRDLAKSLGKEIDLELEGTEVELDKSVLEALTDPLTHLVRNSADHGLEDPDAREKSNKSRIGLIKLNAYQEGGYVNIEVIDNGAGIDCVKIVEKAVDKGIITKEAADRMSEQEIFKLIFKPGFSTAEKVSDVSGRGVGMDVVRTNIEKLGGSIEIFSRKGTGTTIRLMLPLTLAIIQTLIVGVEGHKFALPQANLKEIVRIKAKDKNRHIEYLHDAEVIRLRGKLLPIVHLADMLGIKRTYIDEVSGEKRYDRRRNFSDTRLENQDLDDASDRRGNGDEVTRVLVLQVGHRSFGLAVDYIYSSEETLVKQLPVYFKNCDCYSGVTIMGDGKTAMILDVEGLIRISNLKFADDTEEKDIGNKGVNEYNAEVQNILLFKCSGTETFAIDLSMVSRVEEVRSKDIERIGNREYIKFRGDSMRVIRPEDFLPVSKDTYSSDVKQVLIPKYVKRPIGIIVEKIIDNVNAKIALNTENIKVNGILGSTIFEDRIILILNLYEILQLADPEHYSVNAYISQEAKTILLVEDTPFFMKMEKEYLEMAGYEVIQAANGRIAMELLENNKVDVVVSDIQMPEMDGFELVKKIREDKRLTDLPVIAVTSMSGEDAKTKAYESGFNYYELKLDRDRLLEAVHKALNKKDILLV